MIIESLQSGVKFHGKISNWVIIESTKYDIILSGIMIILLV